MSKARNLSTLLSSDGSVKPTKYADSVGGQSDFVASGTLPNGTPVVLNSDGTIEAVGITSDGLNLSQSQGTQQNFAGASGNTGQPSVSFDPNDSGKFVISYPDANTSGHGKCVAGTVSGTTMTFGTPVTFHTSASTQYSHVYFDPNEVGKFVLLYVGTGSDGYYRVGTVSGTSITFGTAAEFSTVNHTFDNTQLYNTCAFDWDPHNAGKFALCYMSGYASYQELSVVVGNRSGDTLTFGTVVQVVSGQAEFGCIAFDKAVPDKALIAHRAPSTQYPTVRPVTISGTTITLGTAVVPWSNYNSTAFVASTGISNVFVIAHHFNAGGTSWLRSIKVNSLTSITSSNMVNMSTRVRDVKADPNKAGRILVTATSSNVVYVKVVTATDFSVANAVNLTIDSHLTFTANTSYYAGSAFDPANSGKYMIAASSATYGAATIGQLAVTPTTSANLTSSNFIGIPNAAYTDGETATVNLQGSTASNVSGLTAGNTYYVQTDGTLSTSAGSPSVEIGKALSSTSILLKGI